jgi:hypothetical protein
MEASPADEKAQYVHEDIHGNQRPHQPIAVPEYLQPYGLSQI